jgi:dipeptidyl aminopeptidase/acylaminoacyl peptidase
MKTKLPIIMMALLMLSIYSCKEEIKRAPKIALEDFFKNPEKSRYQISPDGKYYSYMAPYQNRMNVFIQERGKEKAVQITKETDRDIAGYFWPNNEQILYVKDQGGDENYRLYGVNIDGTNEVCFTEFEGVRTMILDDLPDIEEEVVIGMNKRNPQVFDPYRLNIKTGEMTMIAENPGNIDSWIFDHEGKLRAASAVNGVNASLLYRETEEAPWDTVLTTTFKETMAVSFFTFDNKNVYAISNLGRDKAAVVEFDIANGKEIKVLYENPDYDVDGVNFSHKRKVLTTASFTSWKNERHYFDDESKKLFERIEKELGDYELGISAVNKDETVFVIRTYSDRSLGAYYIFDSGADKLEKISDVSPWIDENNMAKVHPIKYNARDGLTINGYLTLPKGYTMETAKNLSVVVNPHGGPWARDGWGFNPEIQFLANRGYAVLQMNYRGSTGYGKEFWMKSFKQWGKTMQDDITDGVQWLIDEGIANKEKIAIYGGSYGGYATLAGVTFTPDLYACGVDYVGVSSIFSWVNAIPAYWEPYRKMLYEMVGDPVADSLLLAEASPLFHVDKIKVPMLVAQGANDPRVPKPESDQIVEALKAKGIEVEYIVKDNEGHGFRNEENRFDFYGAMEKFLQKHIGEPEPEKE